jgi:ribosome-interacting GTPase 1
MPTNLPPEALEAEREYRAAQTVAEKIASLEEYLALIPKHKGTDKLRADLRKRLSKLKVSSSHIRKEGAGQLVVIGPTNVGKSALVDMLTTSAKKVLASL